MPGEWKFTVLAVSYVIRCFNFWTEYVLFMQASGAAPQIIIEDIQIWRTSDSGFHRIFSVSHICDVIK
jgi:hypothetical protein